MVNKPLLASSFCVRRHSTAADVLNRRIHLRGVPNGTTRVRVTKEGYIDQEREVTGVQFTGAHFYLQRR
jgi:hypothetical protein